MMRRDACPRFEVISRGLNEPLDSRIAAHVERCPRCRATLDDLGALREMAAKLPVASGKANPAHREAALLAAVERTRPPARPGKWAAAMALSAVAGALAVFALYPDPPGSPERASMAHIEGEPGASYEVQSEGSKTVVVLRQGVVRLRLLPNAEPRALVLRAPDRTVHVEPGSSVTVEVQDGSLRRVERVAGQVRVVRPDDPEQGLDRVAGPRAAFDPEQGLDRVAGPRAASDPATTFARVYARLEAGDLAAAAELERWLKDHPNHALAEDALFWAGTARLQAGAHADAIPHFERYLTRFPDGRRTTQVRGLLRRARAGRRR